MTYSDNVIDSCYAKCGGPHSSGDAVAECERCGWICLHTMDGLKPMRDPYSDGYYYCERCGNNAKHWYKDDFMRIK